MTDRKYCVILGASGGIGGAISRNLASAGWSLYLHYNQNAAQATHLSSELSKAYPEADFQTVQADFSAIDGADLLAKQVRRAGAIIVSNGQSMLKLLTETTVADMDALWRVHVQNPARLISLLSPQLRAFEQSYVVMIGSIWGNTGAAGEVMYSAVKGAQHAFVKAYAKETAYSGVRVNAVAPGWIETRMNADIPMDERQMIIDTIPLMSCGTPEDVAEAVNFLLSGKADYMTGEIMKVNGGWYI